MINVILIAASLIGQGVAIDGDTVRVGVQSVRLWGVDAPERGTAAGRAAKARMVELVEGQHVICEPTGAVSYNRIVAICYVDFKDIGEVLIIEGLAKPYCRYAGTYYNKAARAGGMKVCK